MVWTRSGTSWVAKNKVLSFFVYSEGNGMWCAEVKSIGNSQGVGHLENAEDARNTAINLGMEILTDTLMELEDVNTHASDE